MKAWAFAFGTMFVGAVLALSCGGTGVGTGFAGGDGGIDVTLVDAGKLISSDGAGNTCNKLTCAALGYTCGLTGDGCGGMLDCGTCTAPETCGGGGKFSVCGGSGPCKPKTCADLGANCGPEGDGCGNVVQCGSCTKPDICGGGGTPSNCGSNGVPHPDGGLDGGPCVPKTCASQNIGCGPAGDGCGNLLACGSCTTPGETCGGGAMNGQCGKPAACVPATCSSLGITCGPTGDGCGGMIASCGTCSGSNICGGGGQPGVCGNSNCTGLCLSQTACGGSGTTISGRIVAGTLPAYGNPDPIPNVLVYVPNGTPAAFSKGVQCAACTADVSGAPLVQATTDYLGNFTLTNVPVPASGVVPIVIQLGRWRRVFGLGNPNNPAIHVTCSPTTNLVLRMPRSQAEGDIPLTAISTGQIDPMECVLLKMGVASTEFTDPGAGGRIEMYVGNGSAVDGLTPPETSLVPDAANATSTIDQYDQVLFPCWGKDPLLSCANGACKSANQQNNVLSYTNAGGRMFATHLSYSWLSVPSSAPFDKTATWVGDPTIGGVTGDLEYDTGTANITQPATGDVETFYNWMNHLAANGAAAGSFPITEERNNFSAVGAGSQLWVSVTGAATPITGEPTFFPAVYTFNTPYSTATPPPAQCGKVIYSDFHVSVINGPNASNDSALTFPNECTSAPMSAQEKALEYLIWDLSSCVGPPPAPTCTKKTCADVGANCGPVADGCGGLIASCGTCSGCETCGGGGKASVCGGVCCQPQTCAAQGIECGPAGDGCGNQLPCGTCPAGLTCGGGGINGKCGSIDAGPTCQPETCASQGIKCGPAGDGCGNEILCGSCPAGQACGAGGQSGVCAPVCVPKTCQQLGFDCGPTGDGCGHEIHCGVCKAPQSCGGGGKTSVCGGSNAK